MTNPFASLFGQGLNQPGNALQNQTNNAQNAQNAYAQQLAGYNNAQQSMPDDFFAMQIPEDELEFVSTLQRWPFIITYQSKYTTVHKIGYCQRCLFT